jgi:hypothetical protein
LAKFVGADLSISGHECGWIVELSAGEVDIDSYNGASSTAMTFTISGGNFDLHTNLGAHAFSFSGGNIALAANKSDVFDPPGP